MSAAAPESEANENEPFSRGHVLDGRYRLGKRLGRGGFGDVFRAEELLPDGAPFREVALKLLLGSERDVPDWAEEAKLLASFRHPSLVTIYAAGILGAESRRFVAMELLLGHNLNEVLRARGPIPWRRVVSWAYSAAAALDVIHARGVVHLDLKPANLYLCDDGALKVLDFGIARRAGGAPPRAIRAALGPVPLAHGDALLPTFEVSTEDVFAATRPAGGSTTARTVIGTPGFMAPEILALEEPTAAADAYALAVCLAQLATGKLPHAVPDEPEAWDDVTLVSRWLEAIRDATERGVMRDLTGSLPKGVCELVLRLLAVDPSARRVEPGHLAALFEAAWHRPHGVPVRPFRGLSPFSGEDEGLLFGRDDDIARLGRELEYEGAVVLQGARGVGKTSLALAGLLPYLALRNVDGKDDWRAAIVDPGDDPDAALEAALAAFDASFAGLSLDDLLAKAASGTLGLAIVLDPAEKALGAESARCARLEALLELLCGGTARPGIRFIGVLAEERARDFTGSALRAPLRSALRFVGAPSTAAVEDIVGAAPYLVGTQIEGAEIVAADVQAELRASASRLPFVAMALEDFWETRASAQGTVVLRAERFRDLGGVKGALVRHADRVLSAMTPEVRVLSEEALLRLSSTDGTPVEWVASDLEAALGGEGSLGARALRELETVHLVRLRDKKVTIAHEALLTAWPHLAALRLSHMDRLAFLERVREAALVWDRADRHREVLERGSLLAELRDHGDWLARGLTATERDFVRESLRRAKAKRLGRAAMVISAVIAVVAALFGLRALERARRAEETARKVALEIEQMADLASRARRSGDVYQRVAFTAAAMAKGSPDGTLPLELADLARRLARADLLTLDPVRGAVFPWDDRWLLAEGAAGELVVVDFRPPGKGDADDIDSDADLEEMAARYGKRPRLATFFPHEDALVEKLAFAFDTAFATRSESGEVRVFRLRKNGTAALAAVSPVRCAGALHLARRAPVVVCSTDDGVARWDMRRSSEKDHGVDRRPFHGAVADVADDGEVVALSSRDRVLLWEPTRDKRIVFTARGPVRGAALSPRDRVVAVASASGVELVDIDKPDAVLLVFERQTDVEDLRWDERGTDLGVCTASGVGRWLYVRKNGRAKGDVEPVGNPCSSPPRPGRPTELARIDVDELRGRTLGSRLDEGGWKLPRDRVLAKDLTVFDGRSDASARLLSFRGRDDLGREEEPGERESVARVEREDAFVAFQIADEIRVYDAADHTFLFARRGNLIRKCADGRLLAWSKDLLGVRVFDAWSTLSEGHLRADPGFFVGADTACTTVYTQTVAGPLVAHTLRPSEYSTGRVIAEPDGYVYEARPLRAGGGAGLLLALSSGAIARIDEATHAVRVLGYATPRATAIGEGRRIGEVAFADASGVSGIDFFGKVERYFESYGEEWEDLSVSPDGSSMLLASAGKIAVLDLARHEIAGLAPTPGKARFSAWDDEGSVFVWSFDRMGGAEGLVIPRGKALARRVASRASNLQVEGGRLSLKR